MVGPQNVIASFESSLALELISCTTLPHYPDKVARAAASALAADGVSLSLRGGILRVPIGASGSAAATAERLQFTLGEGPCLDALTSGESVQFDHRGLQARWPRFAQALTSQTPFRSACSIPLPLRQQGDGGAMDVYGMTSEAPVLDATSAGRLAARVLDSLVRVVSPLDLAGPDTASDVPWLDNSATKQRLNVWVAIGLLGEALGHDPDTAVQVLRREAEVRRSDLDGLVDDLVEGRVAPQSLRG